ncbi:hypothetical protein [Priestia koreensis]|uniref:hypothetical protein n=1 Tax=Priestia koreensis TaxID=284581 RepID=UPI0006A960B5|nr:hypothetical protein [Priestia koreensis]
MIQTYKGRTIEIGATVDVYRNLNQNGLYSVRDSKTGLVCCHSSSVRLSNVTFKVSESGRQKTVSEKRKRVHAFVRGTLEELEGNCPNGFEPVYYNPYVTSLFVREQSNLPIHAAESAFFEGKYAYAPCENDEYDLFSFSEMEEVK